MVNGFTFQLVDGMLFCRVRLPVTVFREVSEILVAR